MAAILGNGSIQFGDGTTTSTALINYTNVVGKKINLSEFSNDLGNYGGFINSVPGGLIYTSNSGQADWQWGKANMKLNVNAGALTISFANCNCVCNC
jgi:hypothetical protein